MKLRNLFIGLMLSGISFISCTNDPLADLSIEDSQVFITNKDDTVNFKAYKTYSIADSVSVIQNNVRKSALTSLDRAMLVQLAENLERLGYQYVPADSLPDVGVSLSRVQNTSVSVVSQPYYWGYGGYGYGYPSYYSYYQTSETYWSMAMLDLKNADHVDKKIKVVWNAQIRGGWIGNEQFVKKIVRAVFDQSPYLQL
jgi:hypothetical protein